MTSNFHITPKLNKDNGVDNFTLTLGDISVSIGLPDLDLLEAVNDRSNFKANKTNVAYHLSLFLNPLLSDLLTDGDRPDIKLYLDELEKLLTDKLATIQKDSRKQEVKLYDELRGLQQSSATMLNTMLGDKLDIQEYIKVSPSLEDNPEINIAEEFNISKLIDYGTKGKAVEKVISTLDMPDMFHMMSEQIEEKLRQLRVRYNVEIRQNQQMYRNWLNDLKSNTVVTLSKVLGLVYYLNMPTSGKGRGSSFGIIPDMRYIPVMQADTKMPHHHSASVKITSNGSNTLTVIKFNGSVAHYTLGKDFNTAAELGLVIYQQVFGNITSETTSLRLFPLSHFDNVNGLNKLAEYDKVYETERAKHMG